LCYQQSDVIGSGPIVLTLQRLRLLKPGGISADSSTRPVFTVFLSLFYDFFMPRYFQ